MAGSSVTPQPQKRQPVSAVATNRQIPIQQREGKFFDLVHAQSNLFDVNYRATFRTEEEASGHLYALAGWIRSGNTATIAGVTNATTATGARTAATGTRKPMSAAARKRISEAAKARYAATQQAQAPPGETGNRRQKPKTMAASG